MLEGTKKKPLMLFFIQIQIWVQSIAESSRIPSVEVTGSKEKPRAYWWIHKTTAPRIRLLSAASALLDKHLQFHGKHTEQHVFSLFAPLRLLMRTKNVKNIPRNQTLCLTLYRRLNNLLSWNCNFMVSLLLINLTFQIVFLLSSYVIPLSLISFLYVGMLSRLWSHTGVGKGSKESRYVNK